tara:strand:- start:399 stop:1370 length:972 start_codon:yes stop_codon:yes gene_type:complete
MASAAAQGSIARMPTRTEFAAAIQSRLLHERHRLAEQFANAQPTRHFAIDELLPPDWLREVASAFPDPKTLLVKKSLREHKRVGIAVDEYPPVLGALLYAFQDQGVVDAIGSITKLQGLQPDPSLYASGISMMTKGDFLNPHLDNSHDGDQRRYRVLNLLLYATPDWHPDQGGSLELWDRQRRSPLELPARFNRLVVMETGPGSWHSVRRVLGNQTPGDGPHNDGSRKDRPGDDNPKDGDPNNGDTGNRDPNNDGARRCISNYYFAEEAPTGNDYRHVTSFAGRPEEPIKRVLLAADAMARNLIGRAFPRLLQRSSHRRTAPK